VTLEQFQLNNREKTFNPYPDKPRLTFKLGGTFKLTVFSDLHFGENPWDDWGPKQDVKSLALMDTVLADEKPDYVCVLGLFSLIYSAKNSVVCGFRVINGDLITGESRPQNSSPMFKIS